MEIDAICQSDLFPISAHGGIPSGRGTAWKYHQPAKRNFSLNFCETRSIHILWYTLVHENEVYCVHNLALSLFKIFFFFDVTILKGLSNLLQYCFSLGFGLLVTRYVGS